MGEGKWKAFPFTRGETSISHLLFADDVILLGEASVDQARLIKTCLQEFCTASGQKVSGQKSSILFSPNTNDAVRAGVCNIMEMPQTEDLGRYLGAPTINGRVTKATYQSIIEKVDKRLAGWKTKCLSLAGRATLIQATIGYCRYSSLCNAICKAPPIYL